jgi:putative transposase
MKLSVLKAYKFRIYPTEEQKSFFIQTFGCVRFTYNQLLKAKMNELTTNNEEKEKLTPAKLKKDYPFLKETDSLALSNAQRNLERAFRNYFQKRAGFPKLKTKKSTWQSYTTNNQQHTVYLVDNQLKLPKLKSFVAVRCHRPINGTIKSATISARNNEEFYVSILCVEEIQPLPKSQRQIALVYHPERLLETDRNLPFICDNTVKAQEKLARAERKLKVKANAVKRKKMVLNHASNYQKQKDKVSQLYRVHRYQKMEYIDQVTFHLVKHYDTIFLEQVTDEETNLTGNFSLSDWHQFIRKISYKAQWYGKELRFISLNEEDCQKMTQMLQQIDNEMNWEERQGSPRG